MRQLGLLFASSLSLMACGGPTVGEIFANEVTLSLSAFSSAPESVAVGEARGGVAVERATLRASSLSFVACRDGAADVSVSPRAYELLDETPPAETVTTAVTELCGVRLELDPLAETQVDGVPEDATLLATGTDGAGEAFELSSPRSLSLSFEADGDQSFGDQPLLLGFDLATWLEGLPTRDSEADTEAFAAQLAAAAALYIDANGNGVLDDDERTPSIPAKRR